jgi:hypothetical protein
VPGAALRGAAFLVAMIVAAGGAGLRYLIARKHGLHMGLDVAAGPDKPVFYVMFGNAWLRP